MKKITALLLALCMVFALCACGSSSAPATTTAPSAEPAADESADTSLDYILEKGTLIVGFDDAFPPFTFQIESGDYDGFDIEAAKALGEKWGVEVILQPVAWESKEQELESKNIDIIWSGLGMTADRLTVINMSIPYVQSGAYLVTKEGSGIDSIESGAGHVVAMQAANAYVQTMSQETLDSFSEIIYMDTVAAALMQLDIGAADFVICDGLSGAYTSEQSGYDFVFLPCYEELGGDVANFAIGCRLGDDALTEKINDTLYELRDDGTLATLSEKWFGGDYISVGIIPDVLAAVMG